MFIVYYLLCIVKGGLFMKYNVDMHGLVNGQKVTVQTMEEVKAIVRDRLPIAVKMQKVADVISKDPIVKEQYARNRSHAKSFAEYIEYNSIATIRSTLYAAPMSYSKGSAPGIEDHVTGYVFSVDDFTKLYLPYDTKNNTYFGRIEVKANEYDAANVALTAETRSKLLLALNELEQARSQDEPAIEVRLEIEEEREY